MGSEKEKKAKDGKQGKGDEKPKGPLGSKDHPWELREVSTYHMAETMASAARSQFKPDPGPGYEGDCGMFYVSDYPFVVCRGGCARGACGLVIEARTSARGWSDLMDVRAYCRCR